MTKRVTFEGKQGQIQAELALPASGEKGPAVVVVQEWHGVNEPMKTLVDRFTQLLRLDLRSLGHGAQYRPRPPCTKPSVRQGVAWA